MRKIDNPPNPFSTHDYEYFAGSIPDAELTVFEDTSRSILSRNDSPDLSFRWSLNPYRGCSHGCIYCYARPTHEYLGFGAGSDFDTKIVIKKNAAELLRKTFLQKSWKGEIIVFSGNTDCYQPLEASYGLTRNCLEVCAEFSNPVAIITKSCLILRDLDLLKRLHERTHLSVFISIAFKDDAIARSVEPNAARLDKRFEIIEKLSSQGMSVGVLVAPIIPGLNDSDIPWILEKARKCGAKRAVPILLRLPANTATVFMNRIQNLFPMSHGKISGRIRQSRDGNLYKAEFGKRFSGEGPYWDNLIKIFDLTCRRMGLETGRGPDKPFKFKRLEKQNELELFPD